MFKAQILHTTLVKTGLLNHVDQCNKLLQAYINSQALSDAQKLLDLMLNPNVVSYNTILSGYFKSHLVSEALKLFNSASKRDCQSWNIVISGCVQNQRLEKALTHFVQMRRGFIKPDNFTYSIVIPCCDLGFGKQVHAEVIKVCSNSDAFLGTNLLRMYAGVGDLAGARKVFDRMSQRDLVTWNALISCYSKYGMGDMSIELFCLLIRERIFADEYTYATILSECASRLQVFGAMQVHSLIIRRGFCFDRFTNNALVNMYSKCGFVVSASRVFEEMPEQDVVSWTTIICGVSQTGQTEDALRLFHKMRLNDVEPNSFTFGCLLSGCANASAFHTGKRFHGLVLKYGLGSDVVVGSAIVDMYSKCGVMDDAYRVFQSIPKRDLISWNGLICGFAQNGKAMKALKLYDEMVQLGPSVVAPNDVTFVGVLSACSHKGLLEEGCNYFHDMIYKHPIKPKPEHYTCIVDLLGRAGLLEEAEALILALPFKPDAIMWGALLGASKLHGNLQMARRITKHLYASEPGSSSNYVLLANSYTNISEWAEALEVRELMNARGVPKISGCSWVDMGSYIPSFMVGDRSHPQIEVIFEVLHRIYLHLDDRYENEFIHSF